MFSFLHRPISSLHKTSIYHQEPWYSFHLAYICFYFVFKEPVVIDLKFLYHQGTTVPAKIILYCSAEKKTSHRYCMT